MPVTCSLTSGAAILAYAAISLAEREPTKKYTFGFYRAEILAAFVSAEVLFLIATVSDHLVHLLRSISTVSRTARDPSGIMLWVAVAGLIANLVSMRLLRSAQTESLNLKAAYLEGGHGRSRLDRGHCRCRFYFAYQVVLVRKRTSFSKVLREKSISAISDDNSSRS
jgi:hypothetical protein